MTTARVRIDYGLRFDCVKNGCPEPCAGEVDDVMPRGDQRPVVERVNGHAVTPVQRTVTYSKWEDVPSSLPSGEQS